MRGTGAQVGNVGGTLEDTQIINVIVNGGVATEIPFSLELLDENGNPINKRPVATGETVRIPVAGGSRPLTVSGRVTRGGDTQELITGTEGVALADPAGARPILIEDAQGFVFNPSRGGLYEFHFQDAEHRSIWVDFEVRPQVAFSSTRQLGTAGQELIVRAVLEGNPGQYPVVVPYRVQGHDLLSASDFLIEGEFLFDADAGRERSRSLALTPGVNVGDVLVTMVQGDGPEYALLGNPFIHQIVLRAPQQMPLHAVIALTQDGEQKNTVVQRDGGLLTLTAAPPNAGAFDATAYSFDWSQSSQALGITAETSGSVTIDPTQLTGSDVYRLQVVVSDKSAAGRSARAELRLRVTGGEDADVVAALEQFVSDPAGSRHRLAICPQGVNPFRGESERTCNRVDRSGEGVYLQAPEGYSISLGALSERASWETGDFGLEVDTSEIKDESGNTAANAHDEQFEHTGYRVDFEIGNLDFPGQSVPVVVPLPRGQAIPADAVWRKYLPAGWTNFIQNDANQLDSAPALAGGGCPWPGSSHWQPGLNSGHSCVRLVIEDGGPNDWDGEADGVIRDPGTLAVPAAETDPDLPPAEPEPVDPVPENPAPVPGTTTAKMKSGGSADGWLLSLLALGLMARRRQMYQLAAKSAVAVLIASVTAVNAGADPHWYVGGQLGRVMTGVDSSEVDARLADEGIGGSSRVTDENRLGHKLFAGYQFTPILALEGGYTQLGEISTRFENLPADTSAQDLNKVRPGSGYGGELALVAGHHFSAKLRGIARAGVLHWRAEHRIGDSSHTASGTDALLGLGVELSFNPAWTARVSWDRYSVENDKSQWLGLGMMYRFGAAPKIPGAFSLTKQPSHQTQAERLSQQKQTEVVKQHTAVASPVEGEPLAETSALEQWQPIKWTPQFARNQRTLANQEILSAIAAMAKEHPQQRLTITGYTDNTGSEVYNLRVSEERAQSVAKALVALGVDAKRLTVSGKGMADPIAPNTTEEGRALNRRAEVRLESW